MKAMLIRLVMVVAVGGACALAMILLGPWAFMLAEALPPASQAAALGDLDGDGDLDAFIANAKNEQWIDYSIWLNQGGVQGGRPATFAPAPHSAHPGEFYAVALGDLDADGDPDALVGGVLGLQLFVNRGGRQGGKPGVFDPPSDSQIVWAGLAIRGGLALGDLDGDGALDALAAGCCRWSDGSQSIPAEGAPPYLEAWLNVSDPHGTRPVLRPAGWQAETLGVQSLALGDLDGDADLDAVTLASAPTEGPASGAAVQPGNQVWLNDGAGRYAGRDPAPGWTGGRSLALGDLDRDGDLDALVLTERMGQVWWNDGAGRFTDGGRVLSSGGRQVLLGDLDGDGDLDALLYAGWKIETWRNTGNGRFRRQARFIGDFSRHAPALGDLDGDGDLDIFAGRLDRDYRAWLNNSAGQFDRLR